MIQRVIRKMQSMWLESGVQSFDRFMKDNPAVAQKTKASEDSLNQRYQEYTRDVSSPDMAASLELLAFLLRLCRANQYQRIADLGSGISSFVLRQYAAESTDVSVISVDDDAAWLDKTRHFIEQHGLSPNGLMTLDSFLTTTENSFDFILLDLNYVETRIQYVEEVLRRIRPGGMVLFDDVHKPDYRHALLRKLESWPGRLYSLKPVTLDKYNRYSFAFVSEAK